MATRTSRAPARKAVRAAGASAASSARAAATARPAATSVVSPSLPRAPLRPPLERALDDLTRELRAALDSAKTAIAALQAELADLRGRHEGHTHTYTKPSYGGGGHHWIELRFLQSYIDGDYPGLSSYGFWTHGKSQSDGSPDQQTSRPND